MRAAERRADRLMPQANAQHRQPACEAGARSPASSPLRPACRGRAKGRWPRAASSAIPARHRSRRCARRASAGPAARSSGPGCGRSCRSCRSAGSSLAILTPAAAPGLVPGFFVLALRRRLGHDAAADRQLPPAAAGGDRADQDARVQRAVEAQVAERPAVRRRGPSAPARR